MNNIKAVEVIQYRTIEVRFEYEEKVDGITIQSDNKASINSQYDTLEKLATLTKLMKSLVRKGKRSLLITIEGLDENYRNHAIKRYSFFDWNGKFNIEHRPFVTDYSVEKVEDFDTNTKLVKAFGIDFMAQILAHIDDLKEVK